MQTILLWLIPLFPALAALVLGLLPLKHNSRGTHLAAAAALAVNTALSHLRNILKVFVKINSIIQR